jgi:hypothetical protein
VTSARACVSRLSRADLEELVVGNMTEDKRITQVFLMFIGTCAREGGKGVKTRGRNGEAKEGEGEREGDGVCSVSLKIVKGGGLCCMV